MSEPLAIRRKRLVYQSRYRGRLEGDLLLGRFANRHIARLDRLQLDLYEALLCESDHDLFAVGHAGTAISTAVGMARGDAQLKRNNNVVDLVILWTVGLMGFGMRVLDVPVAPCVVGLILGPLAEQQFRRALAISQGYPTVFFFHPISAGLLVTAVVLVLGPMLLRWFRPRTETGSVQT